VLCFCEDCLEKWAGFHRFHSHIPLLRCDALDALQAKPPGLAPAGIQGFVFWLPEHQHAQSGLCA
jgi:hypothetical protein